MSFFTSESWGWLPGWGRRVDQEASSTWGQAGSWEGLWAAWGWSGLDATSHSLITYEAETLKHL